MRDAEHRRRYQREYARRKRAKQLEAKLRTAVQCPKSRGGGPCGGPLEIVTDRLGRMVTRCAWCERAARGICRDCPRPVEGTVGWALRCAEHKALAKVAQVRAYAVRHREELRERSRRRYQTNADERQRRNDYKRIWRKAHPDLVKKQKRREALKQSKHILDYHRRYRTKHREHLREVARRRYYEPHPKRPACVCFDCGDPVIWNPGHGRPPKRCDHCVPERERRRREAVRAGWVTGPVPVSAPTKVRRPRRPALRVEGGRKCPTCPAVISGRTKRCVACRAVDRVAAAAALERRRHEARHRITSRSA